MKPATPFFQNLRILLFCAVLIGGCVLGFCLDLRPETSESEGRDLTDFPTFTVDGFLDGSYTSQLSLWYSDTFPFRDNLLGLSTRLRGLYGLQGFDASSQGSAEGIDPDETFVWDTTPSNPLNPSDTIEDTTEVETTPPVEPDHEVIKGYLVEGKTGYELYYLNREYSDRYARAVVNTALRLNGKAQVYTMVVPMSYSYGVSKEAQNDLKVSDCQASIDWMYRAIREYSVQAGVQQPIITVDTYTALAEHADEYIYFRTDHHWTALGAHYASRAFLDLVGRPYPTLQNGYITYTFDNFKGSLARNTQSSALLNNPDTIFAYAPKSVNTVTITTTAGEVFEAPIVNPNAATAFSDSQRYRCFIDGDYPLSYVHNPAVGDGSSILIIKESYGNAFLPMLVDSYEHIYAVDYRFYRTMSVEKLVESNGIDTVLFLNNPVATSSDYNVPCLERWLAVK